MLIMENKVYVISKATHKDGSLKELPSDWYMDYIIYFLEVGRSAILLQPNGHLNLRTSTVEDVTYGEEGNVVIETRNTVYHLELKEGE
jgi:hypothetical protein